MVNATLNAVYATVLTKASYLPGALVLHHTLISVGSKYPLVIMATPQLPDAARQILIRRGLVVRDVESLQPSEGSHSLAAHDERFRDTWTKLRLADYPPTRGLQLIFAIERSAWSSIMFGVKYAA